MSLRDSVNSIDIGDRVKIGKREGEVFKITHLPNGSKEYRIAFDEGPPQSFICPPQSIEKVFSPIERLKRRDFDPPIHFDLLVQAYRLSLAEELTDKTDALLLLSATPHSGKKWQFWKLVSLSHKLCKERVLFSI